MSNLDSKTTQEQEPIEVWIMTTKNETSDFDNALISVGGSTRKVEKYYRRIVRIRGVIHHIRGRFELLIHSPQEQGRMEEKLNSTYNRQRKDSRRLNEEELAAIKLLESDPKNWKNLGGVTTFSQPTEEDLPDYPPHQSAAGAKGPPQVAASGVGQAPQVKENSEAAITNMQSEGGPVNSRES